MVLSSPSEGIILTHRGLEIDTVKTKNNWTNHDDQKEGMDGKSCDQVSMNTDPGAIQLSVQIGK